VDGTLGLLATTFYTFSAMLLLRLAGAPLIERTQGKRTIEGILLLITSGCGRRDSRPGAFSGEAVILSIRKLWVSSKSILLSLGCGDAVASPAFRDSN